MRFFYISYKTPLVLWLSVCLSAPRMIDFKLYQYFPLLNHEPLNFNRVHQRFERTPKIFVMFYYVVHPNANDDSCRIFRGKVLENNGFVRRLKILKPTLRSRLFEIRKTMRP